MHNSTEKLIKMVWTKRLFDITASLLLIIFLSPLFIAILLALLLEHFIRTGSIVMPLYKDIRLSQGKEFGLLKFNIFKQKVVEEMRRKGLFINTKKLEWSGEIILTGALLRQIYFDEFPQLINVLKGEMSLVGPRPVNLKAFEVRLQQGDTVKPVMIAGITGNFQSYKGDADKTDHGMDLEYFNFYTTHSPIQILINDLKILFRTAKVVLVAKGE